MRGRRKAREPHFETLRARARDRDQRDPKRKIKLIPYPGCNGCQRLARTHNVSP
jgi:hypothetical protein